MKALLETINLTSSIVLMTGVAAIFIPPVRDIIVKFVSSRFQLRIDTQLESFRSEMRRREEDLRRDARTTEQRINAIMASALSGLSAQQSEFAARQLKAIEKLWVCKSKVDRLRAAASMISAIKFEEACKGASQDKAYQDFFAEIDRVMLPENLLTDYNADPIETERPFLSPEVWALFAAYVSILFLSVGKLKMLKSGLGKPDLLKDEHTNKLIKAAAPELSEYIDQYGSAGHYYVLDLLEMKLVLSSQSMMLPDNKAKENLLKAHELFRFADAAKISQTVAISVPEKLKADTPPPPSAVEGASE